MTAFHFLLHKEPSETKLKKKEITMLECKVKPIKRWRFCHDFAAAFHGEENREDITRKDGGEVRGLSHAQGGRK